jgi:hypothetical protein
MKAMDLKSNLNDETKSLMEFCDSVVAALTDKGYCRADCTTWIEPTNAYNPVRVHIEWHTLEEDSREDEWFYGKDGEGKPMDNITNKIIDFLDELEDCDTAYRKKLMSRLDIITKEMDEAGFEGARAIIAAILEPMRENLLEHHK